MADVGIVGAGAAGIAAAIFTRQLAPRLSVRVFDGAKRPGAKILVSGRSRCNVTNVSVVESDFWGGRPSIIRQVLRAFPASEAVAFFRRIGVPLHEEAGGKLFPDSNRSRDVLDALLRELDASGALLEPDCRVVGVRKEEGAFVLNTSKGDHRADAVVLATGGLSLPKTGSDGVGLAIAAALGHTIVSTTPALAPLILEEATNVDRPPLHRQLAGVAHDAELTIRIDGRIATRLRGGLLWTHFGISGPVALNASRHWLRAGIEAHERAMTLNFVGGDTLEQADQRLLTLLRERPKASLATIAASLVPAAVAQALLERLGIDSGISGAHLGRDARVTFARALVEWPLQVVASRGYGFAEATAGGISLSEIDPATMRSRRCPGLFLIGEMLDVDGRIGGFNFQWAWSTAFVAARGISKMADG
jgi:predicted Rossmann fold flavoprotein